jgi:hypothetical protein
MQFFSKERSREKNTQEESKNERLLILTHG